MRRDEGKGSPVPDGRRCGCLLRSHVVVVRVVMVRCMMVRGVVVVVVEGSSCCCRRVVEASRVVVVMVKVRVHHDVPASDLRLHAS